MGLLENLKQVKDAMSPGAIKQGLEASRAAAQGGYAGPTAEQLASLTPEQRAAYDESLAQAARGRAEAEAAHRELHDREVARRALYGPAGEYVYGPLPDAELPQASVEDALAASKAQVQDVLRNPLGMRKPKPPPTAPVAPAGGREEQAATERAARDGRHRALAARIPRV